MLLQSNVTSSQSTIREDDLIKLYFEILCFFFPLSVHRDEKLKLLKYSWNPVNSAVLTVSIASRGLQIV